MEIVEVQYPESIYCHFGTTTSLVLHLLNISTKVGHLYVSDFVSELLPFLILHQSLKKQNHGKFEKK